MRLLVSENGGGTQLNALIADTGVIDITVINDNDAVIGQVTIHIDSQNEITVEPTITPEQVGAQIGKLLRKLDTLP